MKKLSTNRLVFLAGVVLATLYGGAKSGRVSYPFTDPELRYLYDAGSYVTNGYVHVDFTRLAIVPASADLQGWYRPAGSTNDAEWAQMLDTTFADFPVPQDIAFEGAETNDFQFFTTWTPGPAVHTNGVAEIMWSKGPIDAASATVVPWRTGIYLDAKRVSPDPAVTNSPPMATRQFTTGGSNED